MKNEVIVEIKIKTKVSLWDAIKLRIAGATYIHEYVKAKLEREDEKETSYS